MPKRIFIFGLHRHTPNGTPTFARFNANPSFAPEQLNGYELGYRTLLGKNFYLDLAGFYNHYHDLFSEDITGGLLPRSQSRACSLTCSRPNSRNGLYGYTKGVEIAPEWRPRDFWRLRGSYSYLAYERRHAPRTRTMWGPRPVSSAPARSIRRAFNRRSTSPRSSSWISTYRYVSALPAQKVPAYSTGDARIGLRFSRQLDFSVVGRTCSSPWHYEYTGDPVGPVGIRRSVYAKLTWQQR